MCTFVVNNMTMNTTTIRDLRANLKTYFDALEEDHDILLVPRGGNKEAIVMMTLSEYNSMKETEYLLSSPENKKVIEQAMAELEGGETVPFEEKNQ